MNNCKSFIFITGIYNQISHIQIKAVISTTFSLFSKSALGLLQGSGRSNSCRQIYDLSVSFEQDFYIFQNYMRGNEESSSDGEKDHIITFQMIKKVQYGKGVFICGNIRQLGQWNPRQSLRLKWNEGDCWQGMLIFSHLNAQQMGCFEFKFMVSGWECAEGSQIEWQIGSVNRRINIQSIYQGSNLYYAEWNLQHYIFFVKTQDYQEKDTYYIEGSLQALGAWKEKRIMKRLGSQKSNPFISYWKNNPQFAEQSFSRIFMYSFSAQRDISSFNYSYVSFGSTIESQAHPGRTYKLHGNELEKNRIIQFDWQGSKVIIDESTFDKMILQRFTHQIYLASHIHSYKQFHKILEKNVTVLFFIVSKDEDYKLSAFNIKNVCKECQVMTENRIIGDVDNEHFVEQVSEIVDEIERLLIGGHRVCINMSNRLMRLFPIYMLYLILFMGYSFGEALELASKHEKPPESFCKKTRDIYNFISSKFQRGRTQIVKP